MKQKNFIFSLFIIVLFLTSCYRVKERRYLNITFPNSKINSYFLENYIDSVRNKNLIIPDSIQDVFLFGNKLHEDDRFIYFKDRPEEWIIISFSATPCWIKSLYNKKLSDRMINDKDSLSKEQFNSLKDRFQDQILRSAELYGKSHNLPDSVIYETKYQ